MSQTNFATSPKLPVGISAASTGNPVAQTKLAVPLMNGFGVTKDQDQAQPVRWLLRAAISYQEALHWSQKGAKEGSPTAQCALGNIDEFGHGVEKDLRTAESWYGRAAQQGNAEGEYQLGRLLISEPGADWNKAATHLRHAADTDP